MKQDILTLAKSMQAEFGWRWGQSVWNAAEAILPKRIESIRGTDIDCFYHNGRVDLFLEVIAPDNILLKWNNGNGAILCPNCSVIIKTFTDFTSAENAYAHGGSDSCPAYLCDKCEKK